MTLERLPDIPGYRMQQHIGRGGMGSVYRAVHTELERPCAIKVLRGDILAVGTSVKRFHREMRVLAGLAHPNIVKVFEGDWTAVGPYIAMELVQGDTLQARIERLRRLSLRETLWVAKRVLSALIYIHRNELVHRDIKPANVMITTKGEVKLMDFGLVLARQETRLTATDEFLGTIAYSSPEGLLGDAPVDERSDIHQWGQLVFEALAGRSPWNGEFHEIAGQITAAVRPSLDQVVAEVPRALVSLVARCMARAPEERPETARVVEQALAPIVAEFVPTPGRLVRSPGAVSAVPAKPSSPHAQPARQLRLNRRLLLPVAVIMLGLLLVLAAWVVHPSGGPLAVESVRLEDGRCHVRGRAGPGEDLSYTVSSPNGTSKTGHVRVDERGWFYFCFGGLEPDQAYRLTILTETAGPVLRDLRTDLVKVTDGPWVRSGPGWCEVRARLNASVAVRGRLELKGGRESWSEEQTTISTRVPHLLFPRVPRLFSANKTLAFSLWDGETLLSRGECAVGFRVLLPKPLRAANSELYHRMSSLAFCGGHLLVADEMGLIYALDNRAALAVGGTSSDPLAWVYPALPAALQAILREDGRGTPRSVGLATWNEKVLVVLGGEPAFLKVLCPKVRREVFRTLATRHGPPHPASSLYDGPKAFEGVLTETARQWLDRGAGERGLPLPVAGSVCACSVSETGFLLATIVNSDGTTIVAVDLESFEIRSCVLPKQSACRWLVVSGNTAILACPASKVEEGSRLCGLRTCDGEQLWTLRLRGRQVTTPFVDETSGYAYVCDGKDIIRLAIRVPSEPERTLGAEKGEWRIAARGALCAPVLARGHLFLPRPVLGSMVSPATHARPVLSRFTPQSPGASWTDIDLPERGSLTYGSTKIWPVLWTDSLFVFLYNLSLYGVKVPEGTVEWIVPFGAEPRRAPFVVNNTLFAATGYDQVLRLPLVPSGASSNW